MTGLEDRMVRFPAMRAEVSQMLASLADVEYQKRAWLNQQFGRPGTFEDLDLVVHILYDDAAVLPAPSECVGDVLFEGEVARFENLEAELGPILDRLAGPADMELLCSPEWSVVAATAGVALATMVRHGNGTA